MKRLFLLVVLLALLVTPALSAQEPLVSRICLITDVGRVDDGTFNQFAFEGMERVAEDYGLESTYIETVNQADYSNNMQTCIDSGFEVIISVGFLMTDATLAKAQENPEVYFIGIDQFFEAPPANLIGVQYREDQSGFLAGVMAALMSETGKIGGVYGVPVPAVVKFRNGFEQ
ncbi:MAG: BMP family ABC transporter substrate-binding protein, partial [Anaerolineae bacterium]|nr:BMP family ABC transporter substrate-binding protein [Anaerolineae bacterium]